MTGQTKTKIVRKGPFFGKSVIYKEKESTQGTARIGTDENTSAVLFEFDPYSHSKPHMSQKTLTHSPFNAIYNYLGEISTF